MNDHQVWLNKMISFCVNLNLLVSLCSRLQIKLSDVRLYIINKDSFDNYEPPVNHIWISGFSLTGVEWPDQRHPGKIPLYKELIQPPDQSHLGEKLWCSVVPAAIRLWMHTPCYTQYLFTYIFSSLTRFIIYLDCLDLFCSHEHPIKMFFLHQMPDFFLF